MNSAQQQTSTSIVSRFSVWTDHQSNEEQIEKSRSVRIFSYDWFKSPKEFKFVNLNLFFSTNEVQMVMDYVLQTNVFTIETKEVKYQNVNETYNVIIIELLNPKHLTSLPIYLRTNALFYTDNSVIRNACALLKNIFQSSNQFYSWTLNKEHLRFLVTLEYITQTEFDQLNIIDLQIEYVYWLRRTCQHQINCPCFNANDVVNISCTCTTSAAKDRSTPWTVSQAFCLHMRATFHQPTSFDFDHYIKQINMLKADCFRFKTLLMIIKLNLVFYEVINYRQRFQGTYILCNY